MSVDIVELSCYEYISLIKDIEKFPIGLYGLDKQRSDKHSEICDLLGIDKSESLKITDNFDYKTKTGTDLYLELIKLKGVKK